MLVLLWMNACIQCKERAEQVAYKLEQDLALCEYVASYNMSLDSVISIFMRRIFLWNVALCYFTD